MLSKKEMERELVFCKARIEVLEEQLRGALSEKEGLFQQVEKLQDSLISIRAPDAYRDIQLEKEGPRAPMSAELQEKNRITKEFTQNYINAMEEPLLRTGHDLDDLITIGIVRDHDSTPPSLHGNNES
jgi:hypothetical protein